MTETIIKSIELNDELLVVNKLIEQLTDSGYTVAFAGGAPRDLIHGKEPRDYDLFVSIRPSPDDVAKAAITMAQALYTLDQEIDEVLGRYFDQNTGEAAFAINSGKVQLIGYVDIFSEPIELVSKFDMGLNEAWGMFRDGLLELHATPAFNLCTEHEALGDRHSPPVRITRIQDKYPNFVSSTQLGTKIPVHQIECDELLPF